MRIHEDKAPYSSGAGAAHTLLRDEQTARNYHTIGMNIIPLQSFKKLARYKWEKWQIAIQAWDADLKGTDWSNGLAAVNGIGGWHSIDIDEAQDISLLHEALSCLGLPEEYPWVVRSGSGIGYHIWFRCTDAIPEDFPLAHKALIVGRPRKSRETKDFKQIEVRWHKTYTVLPPTIHPITHDAYQWMYGFPGKTLPEPLSIELVQNLYFTMCESDEDKASEHGWSKEERIEDVRQLIQGPEDLYPTQRAWLKKKVEAKLSDILNAPNGERNNTLNACAYSLGRFIASNCLNETIITDRLREAAFGAGLEQDETNSTIVSAYKASWTMPRLPPQPKMQLHPKEEQTMVQETPASYSTTPLEEENELWDHAPTNDEMLAFTADDAGNGDAMFALYGKDFLYCGLVGWFFYNGRYWQVDDDSAKVKKRAVDTLRKRRHVAVNADNETVIRCTKGDTSRVSGCIGRFQTLVPTGIDAFDSNPDLINCKNGVLDLRTGTLTSHTYTQRFSYCLPVNYEPADYTEWVEYLNGVVGGGQEVIDYLQMALGYSLTGHTREEALFYLFGPTRSGKGTLAEVFMRLLPTPISSMVDFNSFTAKREGDVSNFDLAPLKPTRLIFASESDKTQPLNPAKIKQITGGDSIRACFKHKDFFTYQPQFKIWMLSNWPVNGDPEDDALWGRVRVINFPHSFLGKEDKTKKAHLKSAEILQGILFWAVQGAMKWYQLGPAGLSTPKEVKETTASHRKELDYVGQWLSDCCEPTHEEDAWTSNEEVSASYTLWCKNNNVQFTKGPKALALSLKAKGYEPGKQKWTNGKNKKGVGRLTISRENPNG